MSAEVSFTKRAAAELSRCFNGISVRQSKKGQTPTQTASSGTSATASSGSGPSNPNDPKSSYYQKPLITSDHEETTQLLINNNGNQTNKYYPSANSVTIIKTSSFVTRSPVNSPKRSGQLPPQAPPKTWRARRKNYLLRIQRAKYLDELWFDGKFLLKFFDYFSPIEICVLAQVCKTWKFILYNNKKYWSSLLPVIYCNELRREASLNSLKTSDQQHQQQHQIQQQNKQSHYQDNNLHQLHFNDNNNIILQSMISSLSINDSIDDIKSSLYHSIELRGFDSVCLQGASDGDIIDFASKIKPSVLKKITFGSLRFASVSDKGLEIFLAALGQSINKLELIGCNELTDTGLWTGIIPGLETLIILDCINIADETIAAICQMLPQLRYLQLQAYHVTDISMSYFGPTCIREHLRTLILQHCWELSNQGVVSLAHGLPNLTTLSLSGCSKVTDDAIEVIAEQIRGLTELDLSWCPRVSDAALEYIACDLSDTLQHLILDRCLHITDIGLGYVATMTNLKTLSLRWCPQIRDFGLQTICSMRSLKNLSVAGCPQLTVNGLSCLVQLQQLNELELTNCPGASKELIKYLKDHLPNNTMIIT